MDYLQLSDAAFLKAVNAMNSSEYRTNLANEDFCDRVNGGTTWIEHQEQKALEALVTRDLQNKKDRLNQELKAGKGLSAATWSWLDERNLKMRSLSLAQDVKKIKPIYTAFNEKYGPFTDDERGILITLAQQVCGIGRVLDLTEPSTWSAVWHVAIASGKIGLTRTQPTPEKPKVNLQKAEPTTAERQLAYRNDVVFNSRSLGDLTAYDIDRKLTGDQYKQIVAEGYSADGDILLNTQELTHGKKIEYRPATGIATGVN